MNANPKSKNMKLKTLPGIQILNGFFKEKKRLILFSLFLFLLNAFLTVLFPIYLGKMIDIIKSNFQLQFIIKYGKKFFLLFVFLFVIQIISAFVLAKLKMNSRIYYQDQIFNKIINLPYLQQIKLRTAYLESRWSQDSLNISSFFGENLFSIISNCLVIVFALVASFFISKGFSLVLLFFLITISVILMLISRYLVRQLKKYLEDFSNLSGKVNETISGIVELRIMGFLDTFKNLIRGDIKDISMKYFRIQIKSLFFTSILSLLVFGGLFMILLYFGALISSSKITVGNAIGYIAIIFLFFKSVTNLTSQINNLNQVLASIKRTSELILLPEKNLILSEGNDVKPIVTIEVKDVWFRYDEKTEYILKGISYRFELGKIYAIAGKSGIGKSTLIKTILGIIPISRGQILVNDQFLSDDRIPGFWSKIGYLSQDPFLFKGSLKENLSYFGKQFDKNQIRKALAQAGIAEEHFHEKTEIEEGGKNLSGGERRRVSLARVFLKQPDLLILDEPTSQVDLQTEELINQSILSFAKEGKMVLIIAHSASTLNIADEIIQLNAGINCSVGNGGSP